MFIVTATSNKKLIQPIEGNIYRNAGIEIPLDIKNYFYIRNWAVSSYEKWGLNGNADGFQHKVLASDHGTFEGAWVCLNHVARNSNDSIGNILSPIYTPEQYVETILAIDRKLASRKVPYLEKDLREGRITDTSMGCVSKYSICTVCGHKVSDEKDYCEHLKPNRHTGSLKGSEIEVNGQKKVIGELYENVTFIEDSILTNQEGADINAKIFDIAAHKKGQKTNHVTNDDFYYAIKAVAKEYGNSEYIKKLMEILDK